MRGRRGHSSSSVSQKQTRMALRKQVLKDAGDVPSGSQQLDENLQEEEAPDDNNELSTSLLSPVSTTEKCRRERETKSKPKEMTEEEMMDMALRLSEQEASITALRLQKEEEAVMRAIQESMVGQTQPGRQPQSQSLRTDAEASLRLCSRRKLLYSNRKAAAAEDVCILETDLSQGAKGSGDESNNRNKKRKRKEGSPLLEMPDLSQTQRICSQASPSSSECLSVALDSPQSSDSTQIDDCQLRKSPVFPSTGCRAEIHVPRLSQDLLTTCRNSGFVLCTQDSWTSPQKSATTQPRSPTFPKSPEHSSNLALSKSPVFSETNLGDDGEADRCPDYLKSPVFGRNTEHDRSPSACKPPVGVSNSGFMFSSQESLVSSVSSVCHRPESPVFPRSPGSPRSLPPPGRPSACKSPIISETGGHGCCTSPVFNRAGRRQHIHLKVREQSARPAAAELRAAGSEGTSAAAEPPHSLRLDDHNEDIGLNKSSKSDDAEELKEVSQDCNSAEAELTSDVTLLWSDEDEDVTPVGSPSPVFPEERPVQQVSSLNLLTAASPGTTGSKCRPSSSSSTGRQQLSTAEGEPQSVSQGSVSRPTAAPAGGPTVHYYWGVPFCPRGLNPDTYTQVILAQMEVYEKSLKQAQRCLLRKAEWGEAVLPEPEKSPSPEPPAESSQQLVPRRRGLRLRGKKLSDSPPVEEEEDRRDEEEEEETENKEEEKNNEGEKEPVDTDDCEVCPETQLSDNDDRTQDLTMGADSGPELRPNSSELLEMNLRDDSPAVDQPQEEEEMEIEVEVDVDGPADGAMKGNIPVSSSSDVGGHNGRREEVEEDSRDPDVEEIEDRGLQRSTSPELEPVAVPQTVDCPICQGSFPVNKIEMHAAYCDGEVAVVDERRPAADGFKVSLKPRRKRTRRAEVTEEMSDRYNTGRSEEKCYICQKAVPQRDFSKHTELCIHRQASATAAKGNLLSALDQTESTESEAGPSGSRLQPGEVIDLRDDDDDEEDGGVSAIRISNSPIRSFTPISEATGCLIDFKKQQRSKRLCQRRR